MKFFGAVIIFLLSFLVVILLIALFFLRKLFIKIRRNVTGDYDEETVRRMSEKHYKGEDDGPKFEKDYFKGSGQQGQYRPKQNSQNQKQQKHDQQRTATTREGITIIDNRSNEESQRKIFEKDEGEYVDFVEEKN